MGNLISISFNDDAEKYYSMITVNGVATSHYIEKCNVAGPKEAMLIMVADAPYSKDTIQGKWNQSKGFCNITYPTLELNKEG